VGDVGWTLSAEQGHQLHNTSFLIAKQRILFILVIFFQVMQERKGKPMDMPGLLYVLTMEALLLFNTCCSQCY
jgi:hypothetical protein